MGFIRPEVAQGLNRWREALAGTAAAALGGYWMVYEAGALWIIGTVLAVGGALLVVAGIQRARFRRGGGGPGVVQVDEGQLAYFGPFDGGVVAVADLRRIELGTGDTGTPTWVLSHDGGDPLSVPVDAVGADALFDVFASLPGLDTGRMLAGLGDPPDAFRTIWERGATVIPAPRRLH